MFFHKFCINATRHTNVLAYASNKRDSSTSGHFLCKTWIIILGNEVCFYCIDSKESYQSMIRW